MKAPILLVCISLFILTAHVSPLWACSIGICEPNAQLISFNKIPTNVPVLAIGPQHCYLIDEINSEGVPYDIKLNMSSARLMDKQTNTPIPITIMPSPHRDDVYHLIPEQLQPNTSYIIELDLPERADAEATTQSLYFTTIQPQTLPDASLSIGIDVSAPYWDVELSYDGEGSDCGEQEHKVYDRMIVGTIPTELEPWKELLVWRVKIDNQWEPLSPFDIRGRQHVRLRRHCARGDRQPWPSKSYTFEAFIPGTQRSWRSNTVTTTLDCPPEDIMKDMGNMSNDMTDMMAAMDMSDMPSDMHTSDMSQQPAPPNTGCTQALQTRPNPIILMLLGMLLVSLRRLRVIQ